MASAASPNRIQESQGLAVAARSTCREAAGRGPRPDKRSVTRRRRGDADPLPAASRIAPKKTGRPTHSACSVGERSTGREWGAWIPESSTIPPLPLAPVRHRAGAHMPLKRAGCKRARAGLGSDHMTPWGHARRSLRDKACCNKDIGASWTLGGERQPASDRANDFHCRQRIRQGTVADRLQSSAWCRVPTPSERGRFPRRWMRGGQSAGIAVRGGNAQRSARGHSPRSWCPAPAASRPICGRPPGKRTSSRTPPRASAPATDAAAVSPAPVPPTAASRPPGTRFTSACYV